MMRVCLISPPTVTDFEDPDVAESEAIRLIAEHAPIGILSIAAVLEEQGVTPAVIDLNRWYYDYLRSDAYNKTDFSNFVIDKFDSQSFDLVGLSTICSSYPLTIRIAEGIKRSNPETLIVLGGPQASVVDVPTMKAFAHVDFIVRGEAEESFPSLLKAVSRGQSVDGIQGITFRRGEEVVRNPNAPVIHDLDALPLPAFHLYDHIANCRYVPLELGRGCPFACNFCSTNDFFRRNFRLKSPERLIEQMRSIKDSYGINTFDLIHDMFTVDRKRVADFCEGLLRSNDEFNWNCSARTDCVDDDLIALMAKAGCRGIFFGIETGSARLQKTINKGLDLAEAERMIESTNKRSITTAVSLIYGFPEETMEDVRDTIGFLIDSLRYDYASPQLHILAPLAETPLHSEYREKLFFDDIFSDMSHQGWRQDPIDRAMINNHPDIFPNFYALPTPNLDRQYLKELRDFVLKGMSWFRWLLVALHYDSGDLVQVFDKWRGWRTEKQLNEPLDSIELSIYYGKIEFCRDFLEFVKSSYIGRRAKTRIALSALVEYEVALAEGFADAPAQEPAPPVQQPGALEPDLVPCLAEGVRLIQLEVDYKRMVRSLKRRGRLRRTSRHPVTIASRQLSQKPDQTKTDFLQLSPLSAQLLNLCDGSRTVKQISDLFSSSVESIDGVSADKACVFGLELLRLQNLIVASSQDSQPLHVKHT
ncbi:MAG TPA: radical SAM protein [Blastocatellia bacterium]|nr:radical SAM protein [Blastocatellia bacterium]